MMLALTIIHVIISLLLVVIVLMQHGKQQGLSGAIAGGAETFFGKNKGRTVDAMLKKFTAVIAVLFIISSITFAAVAINEYNQQNDETASTEAQATTDGGELANVTVDENGNLVDENGNIVATADQLQAAQEAEATEAEGTENAEADTAEGEEAPAAEAETEAPAEETPAE